MAVYHLNQPGSDQSHSPGQSGTPVSVHSSRDIILLVPSADLLITDLVLPAKRGKDRLRALPFALEGKLAADIDDQHFVMAEPPHANHRVTAAVVSRQQMNAWLGRAHQKQLEPTWMVPDGLALPWSAGDWSLLVCADEVLVRHAHEQCFTVSTDDFITLLNWKLKELTTAVGSTGKDRANSTMKAERLSGALRVWRSAELDLPDCGSMESHFDGGLIDEGCVANGADFLAASLDQQLATDSAPGQPLTPPLNLLTGDFQPHRTTGSSPLWWWSSAVICLATLGLLIVFTLRDIHTSEQLAQTARAAAESEFQQSFPQVQRIVDLRAQAQQQLERLTGHAQPPQGSQFATLFPPVAELLGEHPQLSLDKLSFSDNQLELSLTSNSVSRFESYRTAVQQRGFSADIQSISTDSAGKTQGKITVAGPAS